jgi:hypothetical protein
MASVDNLLRFSTPTHTHDSSNHGDIYDHSKTALVWSLADNWKSQRQEV